MVQSIIAINHGALGKCNSAHTFRRLLLTLPLSKGVVAWNYPTPPDIETFASRLALSMVNMTQFILNPSATFRHITTQGVDIGRWEVNSEVLVLATNTNYSSVSIPIASFDPPSSGVSVKQVLDAGTTIDTNRTNILFESVGSGAFILQFSQAHPSLQQVYFESGIFL